MINPEKVVCYLRRSVLTENQINRILDLGYLTAPASKRHHLAVSGGLAEHSINVVGMLIELGVFVDDQSAYTVGMLHDLVKCKCYTQDFYSGIEYVQPPYPGHGVASVMIAYELGISLTNEEAAAITWHMGAFGLGERELQEYKAAINRFPRAIILTHAADHLASVIEGKKETT